MYNGNQQYDPEGNYQTEYLAQNAVADVTTTNGVGQDNISRAVASVNNIMSKRFFRMSIKDSQKVYVETAKAVIKAFGDLEKIHSFLKDVIASFQHYIGFNLDGSKYNKKLLSVNRLQLSTLAMLFRLASLSDCEEIQGPLEDLLSQTKESILRYASASDAYIKQNALVKIIQPEFEQPLAECGACFIRYQSQLEAMITGYFSGELETPEDLTKKILAEFRTLDTTQEKSIRDYIQKKGGLKTVLKSNDDIKTLDGNKCHKGQKTSGTGFESRRRETVA
ncbi:hypothetical protein M422DRAFT_785850 [Sphaerobolus stellatus SS14]|uniref:Uncharacterized protein n=1 Tax=Sphaerobolus stellatus (strain SS14) TaxID=990650 RepID=A0A0C9TRM9_SPHS4|nr:hypothetical protein M422DRAFT_785850 [Sphaerobolus stellatus SS14]